MRTMLASVLFVLVACGGKGKSDVADPCKDPCKDKKMMEGHEMGEEHEEHPELTPEMTSFHDVLAPLWHADAGPDREANTCNASSGMLNAGAKIQDAPTPEGVAQADWEANVQVLMLSIVDLQDTCSGTGKDGMTFDQAFGAVHDGFHGLMELLPKG